MGIFLFIVYLILITLFFKKLSKSNDYLLTFQATLILYLTKVAVGLIYGYIGKLIGKNINPDSWHYFINGTDYLKSNNLTTFFTNFFPNKNQHYPITTNILGLNHSYFNNLRYVLMDRFAAILNIISGNRYYINILFFEVIIFIGSYKIFKITVAKAHRNKILNLIICFFTPTFIYWTSGFEKDGICFFLLSSIIYYLYKYLSESTKRNLIITIIFILFLFIIRNYLAVFIIIGILIAIIFKIRNSTYKIATIFLVISISIILIYFIHPLALINERTVAFYSENGPYLDPQIYHDNLKSLIQTIPIIFNHLFFRPYLSEINSLLKLFIFIQNELILLMIIIYFNNPIKFQMNEQNRFINTIMLIFSILTIAMIGLTMPYLSHISRYKTVAEQFFLLLLFNNTNYNITYKSKKLNELLFR